MSQPSNNFPYKLIAYIGTYGDEQQPGGIYTFEVQDQGHPFIPVQHSAVPKLAGYLAFDASTFTLYSVDERKNDGRGPVEPAASILAFQVDRQSGKLALLNSHISPGPRPTYLNLDSKNRRLACASHGDFDHVEKVVWKSGQWVSEYVYDDSTVILYKLESQGEIGGIIDLQVLEGHGKDPNSSPQAGGHAQASGHAHSAVFSPCSRYLLVCDKGTDRILVFNVKERLKLVNSYQFPPETAPRHLEFTTPQRLYLTCEISSELAAMSFNNDNGELNLLDKVTTVADDYQGLNEPAEIRVHPSGEIIYLNNRGEDSLAWFHVTPEGKLTRQGHITLAKSLHPGLAARSFALSPDASYLLVADRPANSIKSFAIDASCGRLTLQYQYSVPQPAFIEFAVLNN